MEKVFTLGLDIFIFLTKPEDTTIHQHPDAQGEREKYVNAFNDTMIRIWRERMTLLGVIDTGRLLASPKALPVRADGRFIEVGLSQSFLEYGLWQDFGTGKDIPRGNWVTCKTLC